jgi:hypothetical protein
MNKRNRYYYMMMILSIATRRRRTFSCFKTTESKVDEADVTDRWVVVCG